MKKIYSLLGTVLISGAAMAQAPYMTATYDFNPGDKYAPGSITTIDGRTHDSNQDRTTYYSEDFDAGFGGWTDAIQTGAAGFKLTNTGHDNTTGNTFIIPTLATSTPTQWVLLDSDADGTSYTDPEAATLTSPVIDLSSSIGNYVAFEFDQFFAEWQPAETEDHLYLGVSTDGVSWTEVEISEGVGRDARPNPERISWDISDEILGNESTVQLRFRWEGAWNYGWQIDNIEIVDINANDVTVVDTWRMFTPDNGLILSKVPQAHASEFVITAIIRNIGHFDATGVDFDWEIFDPSMTSVASGTTADALTLSNATQDTIQVLTGYTPTALGNYTIEWTAVSNEGESAGAETDNFVSDAYYELTDFVFGADYASGTATETDNWPLLTGYAAFGNLIEFQGNDEVSALTVQLTNHPEIENEEIFYTIYKFTPTGTEWEWVADSESEPYMISASDIGGEVVLPITNGLQVNGDDLYLFMVGQWSSAAMPIFTREGDIKRSLIQGRDENGDNRGFFDRQAPQVRIIVGAGDVSIDESADAELFSVYPNPAVDAININLDLNNSENTVINVVDISGKTVKTMNLGNVDGAMNVSISLDDLTTGVYFVELVNSNGKQVKKFVKK